MKGKLLKFFTITASLLMTVALGSCGGKGDKGNSSIAGPSSVTESSNGESSSEIESSGESVETSSEISSETLSETESESVESAPESALESSSEIVSEEEQPEETCELIYALNETSDGYIVTGYNGTPTDLMIPSTYETLPVTGIDMYAFENCNSLTTVQIPNGVISVGGYAFHNCANLAQIKIGAGVTTIERYAIYECASLTNIVVDENNTAYQSIDGNLYTKEGTTLVQYAIGKTDTSFTLPDSVTTIGDDAFAYCTNLTEVHLHNNVKTIGYWVFTFCSGLTKIVIPSSVQTMRDYAFYRCDNLTIYCEMAAADKPLTWGSKWNFTQSPVVWDCANQA